MPVAHYHLRAKPIGKSGTVNAVAAAAYRSGGRGVVATAAYRAAERLTEDSGRVYDFTAKKGVEDAFILVPKDAPIWSEDRGKLWNAAEAAEKRANGRVATELEISLPKELNSEQRRALITGFIQSFVDRYGVAADVALHVGDDPRNLHAHCVLTHRQLGPNGFGDIAHRHTVMSKGREIPVAGITAMPSDLIKIRELWEDHVNAAYRKAGLDLTVSSKSYQEQSLDIRPQLYVGPERKDNAALEQKRQERIEYNKRIMAQRAGRERQALDKTVERHHELPPPRSAEIIELKQPERSPEAVVERPAEPERPWFAAIVAGWHRASPEPAAPQPQQDHLSRDLLEAITVALQSRDPAEQREALEAGVDRAIYIHNGNPDEPPSELAKSLMRIATSALSTPEPERVLVAGVTEAIRRHDLRRQQGELARGPAAEPSAKTREPRRDATAPAAREEREQRLAGRQRVEAPHHEPPPPGERPPLISAEQRAQLERDTRADHVPSGWTKANVEDVAREISLQYRSASERMAALNKQLEGTRWSREQFYLERQAAAHRQPERWGEMGWLRRGLHWVGDKLNVPAIKDQELENWKAIEARATRGEARAAVKVKFLEDALETATADVWRAYDRVKPEAERVLAERQQTAATAQERLRVLDAGERVVHNKVTEWHDKKFDAAEKAREQQAELDRRQKPEARKYKSADDFWRAGVEAGRELRRQAEAERESEQQQQQRPRARLRL